MPQLVYLLLLSLSALISAQPATWPVPQHDLQRTGISAFRGPVGRWHGGSEWRAPLGGSASYVLADSDGNPIVGVALDGGAGSSSSGGSSSNGGGSFSFGGSGIILGTFSSSGGSFGSFGSGFSSGFSSSGGSFSGSSFDSSSRKRGNRQSPVVDEQIQWFNASGYPLLTLMSPSPLSFTYAISAHGNRYFRLIYDSNNVTYSPTLIVTVLGSGTPEWSTTLDDLFANLNAGPINTHLLLFPAADVLLVTGWTATNYSFAGVNASSGQLLWASDTFFFTPRDEISFQFAVTPTDSVAYVSEVTAGGLHVCAYDIDLIMGNYTAEWCVTNPAVSTTGTLGPVVLNVNDSVVIVQYSSSGQSGLMWGINPANGNTYWQYTFSSAIAGVALSAPSGLWVVLQNGSASYWNRGFSFGGIQQDWQHDICIVAADVRPPISDGEGNMYMLCEFASGGIGVTGLHPNQTVRFVASIKGSLAGVTGGPVIAYPDLLYVNSRSYLHAWDFAPPYHGRGVKTLSKGAILGIVLGTLLGTLALMAALFIWMFFFQGGYPYRRRRCCRSCT